MTKYNYILLMFLTNSENNEAIDLQHRQNILTVIQTMICETNSCKF